MSHPLDGCFAKIARATEQFDCLEAEIAASDIFDPDAVTFGQEFDEDAGTIKVTIQGLPDAVPIKWALAAADPLQNLRAALNYLAWELARWNLGQRRETRDPARNTQFPINTKPRAFSDGMVTDLHPDHVAIIKRLQPNAADYFAPMPEDTLRTITAASAEGLAHGHPLAQLADLTNVDKHQALQAAFISHSQVEIGDWYASDCLVHHIDITVPFPLENGAQWATANVTPTGPEPKVKVEDRLFPHVAFGGRSIELLRGEVLGAVLSIARTFEPVF